MPFNTHMSTTVVSLSLPEYDIQAPPDSEAIGTKIDATLEEHFSGKYVALRAVSLAEHEGLTLDQFVDVILEAGTDRHDPTTRPGADRPPRGPVGRPRL